MLAVTQLDSQVETMPSQTWLIFYVLHPVSFLDGALVFAAARLNDDNGVVGDDEVFVARANDVALIVQRLVAVVYCHDPYSLHLASDPVAHEALASSLAATDETVYSSDAPKVELAWRLPTFPFPFSPLPLCPW